MKNKLTKEEKEKIKTLREDGMTLLKIAETIKISYGAVYYHLNKDYFKKYNQYKADYYRNKYKTDKNFRDEKIQKTNNLREKKKFINKA